MKKLTLVTVGWNGRNYSKFFMMSYVNGKAVISTQDFYNLIPNAQRGDTLVKGGYR